MLDNIQQLLYHVIGCSDRVDLWVIKLNRPMLLCARGNVEIT